MRKLEALPSLSPLTRFRSRAVRYGRSYCIALLCAARPRLATPPVDYGGGPSVVSKRKIHRRKSDNIPINPPAGI